MGKYVTLILAGLLAALVLYVQFQERGERPTRQHRRPAAQARGDASGPTLRGRAYVVDADTLQIAGTRIRLHGIDAPERDQSCTRAGVAWRCGQQASAALATLLAGRELRCEPRDHDRYDRVVAVCWAGAVDVNHWLVDQGWAVAYRRYSIAYVAAETEARQARRGIWSGSFEPPEDYRRNQPHPRNF
ncbi:thermonuclease family protein [Plastoroseomonas arctica]|uniref:Thermonuclease family protein n=1 Tax=Plastoroseomonas arctica TaxID=1509237 RepID=A0AAF1K539_9PROT|nr:thermonuclease family protein [Plastoroseomonas arctica]MBR0656331.1 thermonuclease family protein [Plastoroseomonas arctica]